MFPLHQFKDIFHVRNESGLPYVLIGGQAVNYWADKFSHSETELLRYRPFASMDIDFRGNSADAVSIARQLGLAAKLPHRVEMTALAGVVSVRVGEYSTSIEIVRSVPGVRTESLETMAISAEFAGQKIRVLDPISLLLCKTELALTVSQEGRRDIDHLKMLVYCVRAFLREALCESEKNPALQKGFLGAAEKVLSHTESSKGSKVNRRFGIHWLDILPETEISRSKLPKVMLFRDLRFAIWKSRMASRVEFPEKQLKRSAMNQRPK